MICTISEAYFICNPPFIKALDSVKLEYSIKTLLLSVKEIPKMIKK